MNKKLFSTSALWFLLFMQPLPASCPTSCYTLPTVLEIVCDLEPTLTTFFQQTFTAAINEVEESLCEKFMQTWTILDAFIDEVQENFDATFTLLFSQPFACLPILITSSASTSINAPGSYLLCQNITGSITIDADDVILDMNERSVSGNITVSNHDRVKIFKGTIQNSLGAALNIANSSDVAAEGINFVASVTGILAFASTNITINQCDFGFIGAASVVCDTVESLFFGNSLIHGHEGINAKFVDIIDSSKIYLTHVIFEKNNPILGTISTCLSLDNVTNGVIQDCVLGKNFTDIDYRGISLNQTNNIIIKNCKVASTLFSGSGGIQAIELNECVNTIIKNCTIEDMGPHSTTSSSVTVTAIVDTLGFGTIVADCLIDSLRTSNAPPQGIVCCVFISTTTSYLLHNQMGNCQSPFSNVTAVGDFFGMRFEGLPNYCFVKNNNTYPLAGSATAIRQIIFYAVPPTLTSVFFGNIGRGSIDGGIAAVIPLVDYDPSTGLFSATASTSGRELDNVRQS